MEKFNIIKLIRYSIGIIFVFVFLFTLFISLKDYSFSLSTESMENFSTLFKTSGFILTGFVAIYTLEISIELLEHRRNEIKLKNEENKLTIIRSRNESFKVYQSIINKFVVEDLQRKYNQIEDFFDYNPYWLEYIIQNKFNYLYTNINISFNGLVDYEVVSIFESAIYKQGVDFYVKTTHISDKELTEDDLRIGYQNKNEVKPLGLEYFKIFYKLTFDYFSIDHSQINVSSLSIEYKKIFYENLKEYPLPKENIGFKYKLENY